MISLETAKKFKNSINAQVLMASFVVAALVGTLAIIFAGTYKPLIDALDKYDMMVVVAMAGLLPLTIFVITLIATTMIEMRDAK